MDGDWGWDGKDNAEAGLRFMILPPAHEAGYFDPGGVYGLNHSRSLFSLLFALSTLPTQNFNPLCLSLLLATFPFLIFFCPSFLAPLLCPFSLFITQSAVIVISMASSLHSSSCFQPLKPEHCLASSH